MSGISDNKQAVLIARMLEGASQAVIETPSIVSARRLAADLAFFTDMRIMILPEDEDEVFRYEAKSRAAESQRLAALSALADGSGIVVIAPSSAFETEFPPLDEFI